MSDIKYAYLKGQTWLYRRNYPKDVAPVLGSRALKQSLKTGDVKVARSRAAEVNAKYEELVRKVRSGAEDVLSDAETHTDNHLPMWIEAEDRRYYLIEIDHDGHATGETASEFSALIGALHEYMDDDRNIAALYRSLMEREQSPGFSAKTLDVVKDATPLMKRVHTASEATRTARLRECLMEAGVHALPEAEVVKIIKDNLGGNISSTKHLMAELGWSKDSVKWGCREYARSIWTEKGFWAHRGKLHGPDGFEEDLAEHLGKMVNVQLL